MNPETTLPLDFAPLREGAEGMAREWYAVPDWPGIGDAGASLTLWNDIDADRRAQVVGHVARLLSDLTIDASRDRWVRWGIERDVALELARHPDVDDPVRALMRTNLTRNFGRRWSALRDDPEALRAAILAALETR